MHAQPSSHRIPTGEATHCQLLEWRSSGWPVLLVHGLGSNAGTWLSFVRELDPRFRPLALELRGHGDSSWRSEYGVASLVRDLEIACDWIGSPFALIGHSLGGEIALHVAARSPDLVASLILVDVGVDMDPRGRQRIRETLAAEAGDYGSPDEYFAELRESYVLADDAALRELAEHGVRRQRDGRYRAKLDPTLRRRVDPSPTARAASDLPTIWDALASIRVPTLVVRGELSGVLRRETAERMARTLPSGRLEQIPRAGHTPMLDNPLAFARAARAFLHHAPR